MLTTRRLLSALLLACCAVVALGAPSQAACPADRLTLKQHTTRADDVFTGVVGARSVSGNTATYTVEVQRVYKGELAGEQVSVSSDTRPRSCGLPTLTKGGTYVFFTQERGSDLITDRRSGTAPASTAYVARVERLLGAGTPAAPIAVQRLAAPGVALVIVGVLGLVLVAWRGRRRA